MLLRLKDPELRHDLRTGCDAEFLTDRDRDDADDVAEEAVKGLVTPDPDEGLCSIARPAASAFGLTFADDGDRPPPLDIAEDRRKPMPPDELL